MSKDIIKLLGRGKNGWHTSGMTGDGHRFSSSGGSLEDYLKEAPDGCWVYDAEKAQEGPFVHWVVPGPMVDATLAPGTTSKFQDHNTLSSMMPGLQGSGKSLGLLALAGLSSLDSVAPDLYVQMLREEVPGVKVGQVYKGAIVWET